MKVTEPDEVAEYYQQKKIVDTYLQRRFAEPLNGVEHLRQVAILNLIIKKYNCRSLLEFAPGPARITAELNAEGGLSIDSSPEMIQLARKQMQERGKVWRFRQGNILNLKLTDKFDLIFCFRFLLHFKKETRIKIYAKAYCLLQPDGLLVFEAMNKGVVLPLRRLLGQQRYFVYDKLYSIDELLNELEENGFKALKLFPVLNRFWLQAVCSRPFKILGLNATATKLISWLEQFASNQPYEWIVLCQKK